MKILHVFDHSLPIQDGYSYRSRAILDNQHRMGWNTFQLTSAKHESHIGEEDVEDLHFYRTAQSTGLSSKLPILNQWAVVSTLKKRLASLVREIRPDVIHAHSPSLTGLASLPIARKLDIPLVYEIRAFWEDAAVDQGRHREGDIRYRITAASENRVVAGADAVTTICNGLRRELISRGVSEEKVTVIPNGVEVDKYSFDLPRDSEFAKRFNLDNKLVIGFIGSFYAYEGLDTLLEAFPQVLKRLPEARLLLVGGGLEKDALQQKVKKLGLQDIVIFPGRVPHDEVERYYSLLDIVCFPRQSIRLTELVTPLKPLEAMAMGRICLASSVGGHRELIQNGKTGFLFLPEDTTGLAESILEIVTKQSSWHEIRETARRFVEMDRNWPTIIQRYEPIYARLMG